jgi:hypothetical protein
MENINKVTLFPFPDSLPMCDDVEMGGFLLSFSIPTNLNILSDVRWMMRCEI